MDVIAFDFGRTITRRDTCWGIRYQKGPLRFYLGMVCSPLPDAVQTEGDLQSADEGDGAGAFSVIPSAGFSSGVVMISVLTPSISLRQAQCIASGCRT